jgi:tRNA (guanine37-N1)-methyltransferase
MHFDIFTLFPEMFQSPFSASIVKRAQEQGFLSIALHDIRAVTTDRHHIVDDYPYGGGAGMVMKPEPIFTAVEAVYQRGPLILMTPQGQPFTQKIANELAQEPVMTLLCGHYEGIDERVRQHLVTHEISLGDYVLTGGELAAMVIVDATIRLLPGVLGGEKSTIEESHSNNSLEYPQYTRPLEFRGWTVPDVLLSGHHANIARWRRKESLRRTRDRRPDLFAQLDLSSKQDQKILRELVLEKELEAEAASAQEPSL